MSHDYKVFILEDASYFQIKLKLCVVKFEKMGNISKEMKKEGHLEAFKTMNIPLQALKTLLERSEAIIGAIKMFDDSVTGKSMSI